MKRTKIAILGMFILLSLLLPVIISCGDSNDSPTDAATTEGDNIAAENDGADAQNAEEEKSEEKPTEKKEEPGDNVPAGGLLKGYDFADGTLQGIETDSIEGKYFDSTWGPGDPVELKEVGGRNWLQVGSKFTGGWELVLYELPEADMPLLSKASVLKYDVLVPAADIDAAPYVEVTPALKTDWGNDWDSKIANNKDEFMSMAAKFADDYYIFTVNIPYALHGNMIVENGGVSEAWVGIVFNGVTNGSDKSVYIGNIEFIK